MRKILLIFNLVSLILLFFSCEKTKLPVLPEGKALQLEVAEAGVTEAWLQVKIGVKEPGQQLRLYREGELVQQLAIDRDTVVYDSGLAPAHNYTYHAELWKAGTRLGKTNNIILTTMDTTSHDFQWEVITVPSPFGSGALYDVAIINKNDIWAVGEIYSDSANPALPYNAVHWDGEKWELKKVPFYDQTGYAWYTPIYSILAFNADNIWFEFGIHWNGERYESRPMNIDFPSHANRMWGTSSNDLYIVGNRGLIAHYDGQIWRRIESGTEIDLWRIWGVFDDSYHKTKAWVTGVNPDRIYGVVLKIEENQVKKVFDEDHRIFGNGDDHTHPNAVWATNGFVYISYAGFEDSRIYRHSINEFGKEFRLLYVEEQGAVRSIHGNDINDIVGVGDRDVVWHYNGISVKKYFSWPSLDARYYSVKMKEDLVIACGIYFKKADAIILLGRR